MDNNGLKWTKDPTFLQITQWKQINTITQWKRINTITDGGSDATDSKAISGWTDGWIGSNLES